VETDPTRSIVQIQIGRPPRAAVTVAAACPFDLPLVVKTPPHLEDGTPFPTTYYLTCPVAVRSIGTLEADGTMAGLRQRLDDDPVLQNDYKQAHNRYVADRDAMGLLEPAVSAGGMPERVKCLHALYAHEKADSNPIGALVADMIEPLDCPGPCVADLGQGHLEAVPGHPGWKGRTKTK
jgi:uncharacterized protein